MTKSGFVCFCYFSSITAFHFSYLAIRCVFICFWLFPLTGWARKRENVAHQSLGLGWLEQVWSERSVFWTQRPAAFSFGQGYGSNEGNCLLFVFLSRLVCFITEKQLSWRKQYTQSFRHVLQMFPFLSRGVNNFCHKLKMILLLLSWAFITLWQKC